MPIPPAPIRYRVAMPEPTSHEYEVTIDVPAIAARASVDLVFPAWAPGSYLVRDFSRHVYDLEVTDGRGRRLAVERLDKLRWRVRARGRAFRARYRLFAFEISVRTSFLDDSHAYWNGTSLFFFVDGELDRPCLVDVAAPRGWRVSTALPAVPGARRRFRAAGYDELADSPFEIGTHALHAFRVGRTRFEVALYGRTNADLARLLAELRRVCRATGALFGGFPFDRYLFIVHALPARGGGLEHACSATLDVAALGFEDEEGYKAFAELAAHELFHVWNVKRIRDRALGPFDYTRENHTRLLWFHEGFTSFMEDVILLRAGLLDPPRYLRDLAEEWGRYLARPGRNVTPLSELSLEAWIKQYKPAENHHNRTVSYYDKGRWAALVLELLLREATSGRRGVPDLFGQLWESFGRRGVGLTAADLRAAADRVAGRSMGRFFDRHVDGTDELPVPALLRRAGVSVEARLPWEPADEGNGLKARRQRGWSGLSFGGAGVGPAPGPGDRAIVRSVVPGSPAWRAGLTYGDDLAAVDGHRVNAGNVTRRLADRQPGQRVDIAYFRQEILRVASLVLGESPERRWRFTLARAASPGARAIRRGWLGV